MLAAEEELAAGVESDDLYHALALEATGSEAAAADRLSARLADKMRRGEKPNLTPREAG